MRYFADWVADQVRDFAGTGDRDLTVRTTLDPRLQTAAEAAIADALLHHGLKDVVSQGALVAMSPDGAVRTMVGGRDYNQSQFNRATQAQRQPGSSFKPFVYLAGLEAGVRPDDRFVDGPIQIGNWRPRNYTNRYLGEISVAEALAESINTIAVQVAQRAGIPNVIAVANRLGITSELARDASIALGTNEVNLLELVSAYAPFANGGNGVIAYGDRRDPRQRRTGKTIYSRTGNGSRCQVIAPGEVGLMNGEMLARRDRPRHRQGASPRRCPRPTAGKTGDDPGLQGRLVYRLHRRPGRRRLARQRRQHADGQGDRRQLGAGCSVLRRASCGGRDARHAGAAVAGRWAGTSRRDAGGRDAAEAVGPVLRHPRAAHHDHRDRDATGPRHRGAGAARLMPQGERPPRPRWLLIALIVYTIVALALLLPAGLVAMYSPMLSDSGLNASVWALIIGFAVVPVVLVISPIVAWIGYALRWRWLAIVMICAPLVWLLYIVVASYL